MFILFKFTHFISQRGSIPGPTDCEASRLTTSSAGKLQRHSLKLLKRLRHVGCCCCQLYLFLTTPLDVYSIDVTEQVHLGISECRWEGGLSWANVGDFCLYFVLFNSNFNRKIVDLSGIRTQIVRVEGEHADQQTTTTAQGEQMFYHVFRNKQVCQCSYFEMFNNHTQNVKTQPITECH